MQWDQFIIFTKQERRGVIAFLIMAILVISFFKFFKNPARLPPEMIDGYLVSDTLYGADGESEMEDISIKNQSNTFIKNDPAKFYFNPNTIGYDSLILLGFEKYAANNLIKYRNRGGVIYDIEKLKSIYGINKNLVNDLTPYINFGKKWSETKEHKADIVADKPTETTIKEATKEIVPVDINTATAEEMLKLKGVGKYRAQQIIKLREKLGGFVYPAQIVELNALPDSVFSVILPNIMIDKSQIKPISINTAEYKDMITHPYFNTQIINAILKYRTQHGNFESIEHISRIKSLKKEDGMRIMPYLTVD